MKIGELSVATGTPVETIRFYEREGLMPEPMRTESNYRTYDHAHTQRLAFIRRCRSLDMALDEIRLLLRFKDTPPSDCREVNAVIDEHIGHVVQRMRELNALARQLRELRAQCQTAGAGTVCGILKHLDSDRPSSDARRRARPTAHQHVGTVHGRRALTVKR